MGCAGSNLSQTDVYKKSTNFEIVDHGLYWYESKYQVNAKTKAKDASKMIPLGRVGTRLVTQPIISDHPGVSDDSKWYLLIMYTAEGADTWRSAECKMLLQVFTKQEHVKWCASLKNSIDIVDVEVPFKKALATFLKCDPKDFMAHYNFGITLTALKASLSARSVYETAIDLDYQSCLRDNKQYQVPQSVVEKVVGNDPLAPALQSYSARLLKSGDVTAARIFAEEAIRIDPKYADGYYILGMCLGNGKKLLPEARSAFAKAIRLNPENALALIGYGAVLTKLKEFTAARCAYELAITLNPGIADAHFNYGNLLMEGWFHRDADLTSACAAYKKAIEIDPGYAKAYLNYSMALRRLEMDTEANEAYEKAIQLDPSLEEAQTALSPRVSSPRNWMRFGKDSTLEEVKGI